MPAVGASLARKGPAQHNGDATPIPITATTTTADAFGWQGGGSIVPIYKRNSLVGGNTSNHVTNPSANNNAIGNNRSQSASGAGSLNATTTSHVNTSSSVAAGAGAAAASAVPPPALEPIAARKSALESYLMKQSRLGDLHKHLATNVIKQLHGDVLKRAAKGGGSRDRNGSITGPGAGGRNSIVAEKISVFKWVNDRKQEMPTDFRVPRSADRDGCWYWLLVKSFVTRKDCIAGYVPDASRMRSANYYKPMRVGGSRKPECPEPSLLDPRTGKIADRIKSAPRAIDEMLRSVQYTTITTRNNPQLRVGGVGGGASTSMMMARPGTAQHATVDATILELDDGLAQSSTSPKLSPRSLLGGRPGSSSSLNTTAPALSATAHFEKLANGDRIASNAPRANTSAALAFLERRKLGGRRPQTSDGRLGSSASSAGAGAAVGSHIFRRDDTITIFDVDDANKAKEKQRLSVYTSNRKMMHSKGSSGVVAGGGYTATGGHGTYSGSESSYEDEMEPVGNTGAERVVRRRKKKVRAPNCADMLYSLQSYQQGLEDYYRTEWTAPVRKDKATLEEEAFYKKHNKRRAELLGFNPDDEDDAEAIELSTIARIGSPGKRTEKEMGALRAELSRVSEFLNDETHVPVKNREFLTGDEKRKRMAHYGLRVVEGLYQPTDAPHYERFEGKPKPKATLTVENAISNTQDVSVSNHRSLNASGGSPQSANDGLDDTSTSSSPFKNIAGAGSAFFTGSRSGMAVKQHVGLGAGNRLPLRSLKDTEGITSLAFSPIKQRSESYTPNRSGGDGNGPGNGSFFASLGRGGANGRASSASPSAQREGGNNAMFSFLGSNTAMKGGGGKKDAEPAEDEYRVSGKVNYKQNSHYRTQPDYYYAEEDKKTAAASNSSSTAGTRHGAANNERRGSYTALSTSGAGATNNAAFMNAVAPPPSLECPKLQVIDYSFMDLRMWMGLVQRLPRSLPTALRVKETPEPPVLTFLADPTPIDDPSKKKPMFAPLPTFDLTPVSGMAVDGGDENNAASSPRSGVAGGSPPPTARPGSSGTASSPPPPLTTTLTNRVTINRRPVAGPPTRTATVGPDYPTPSCYANGLKAIEFNYMERRERLGLMTIEHNQNTNNHYNVANSGSNGSGPSSASARDNISAAFANRRKSRGLDKIKINLNGAPTTAAHTEFGVFKPDYTTVEAKGEKYCFSDNQNPNIYAAFTSLVGTTGGVNAGGGRRESVTRSTATTNRRRLSSATAPADGSALELKALRRSFILSQAAGSANAMAAAFSAHSSTSAAAIMANAKNARRQSQFGGPTTINTASGGKSSPSSGGAGGSSSAAMPRNAFLYQSLLEEDLNSTKTMKKFLEHPIAGPFMRLSLGRFAVPLLLEEEAVTALEDRGLVRDVAALNAAEEREWVESIEQKLEREEAERLKGIHEARAAKEAEEMRLFKKSVKEKMRSRKQRGSAGDGEEDSDYDYDDSDDDSTAHRRFDSPTRASAAAAKEKNANGSPANFLRSARSRNAASSKNALDASSGANNVGIKNLFNMFSNPGSQATSPRGGGAADGNNSSNAKKSVGFASGGAVDGPKKGDSGKPPLPGAGGSSPSRSSLTTTAASSLLTPAQRKKQADAELLRQFQPIRIYVNGTANPHRSGDAGDGGATPNSTTSDSNTKQTAPNAAASNNSASASANTGNTLLSHAALAEQQSSLLLFQPFTQVNIVNLSHNRLGDTAAGTPFAEQFLLQQSVKEAGEALEARQRAQEEKANGGNTNNSNSNANGGVKRGSSPSGAASKAGSPNKNGGGNGNGPQRNSGDYVAPEAADAAKADSTITALESAIAHLNKGTDRGAPKSITAALSAGIPTRTSRSDRERKAMKRKLRSEGALGSGNMSSDSDDDENGGTAGTGGGGSNGKRKAIRAPRKATDDEQLIESGRLEGDVGGMSFASVFLLQRVSSLDTIAVMDLSYNMFEQFPIKLLHYELSGLVSLHFHGNKVPSFRAIVELAVGVVPASHIPASLLKERERLNEKKAEERKAMLAGAGKMNASFAARTGGNVSFALDSFGGVNNGSKANGAGLFSAAGKNSSAAAAAADPNHPAFMYRPQLERLGREDIMTALLDTADDRVFAFRAEPLKSCFAIAGPSSQPTARGGVDMKHALKHQLNMPAGPTLLPHGTPFYKDDLCTPLQHRLRTLTLHGNPLEKLASMHVYRQKMLLLFPQLTTLDNNPVTVVERSLIL